MSVYRTFRRVRWVAAAVAIVAVIATVVVLQPSSPAPLESMPSHDGLTLQWHDEFDGRQWQMPEPGKWDYDLGGGGWGNSEQQTYTDARANSRLDGNGNLEIAALRNSDGLTSARLVTRGKFEFTYGLLEARIRVPVGPGIHPAFWLLGANIDSVGYPKSGEIDIVETVGMHNKVYNVIHGPWLPDAPITFDNRWSQSHDMTQPRDLAADYAIYSVFREPGRIVIGLDGNVLAEFTEDEMPEGAEWVFDAPMYVLLNVAVGGEWPGPVTADTEFPSIMSVDWIRYYGTTE